MTEADLVFSRSEIDRTNTLRTSVVKWGVEDVAELEQRRASKGGPWGAWHLAAIYLGSKLHKAFPYPRSLGTEEFAEARRKAIPLILANF